MQNPVTEVNLLSDAHLQLNANHMTPFSDLYSTQTQVLRKCVLRHGRSETLYVLSPSLTKLPSWPRTLKSELTKCIHPQTRNASWSKVLTWSHMDSAFRLKIFYAQCLYHPSVPEPTSKLKWTRGSHGDLQVFVSNTPLESPRKYFNRYQFHDGSSIDIRAYVEQANHQCG